MNEFLDAKISARFLVVDLLPTVLFTALVGGLMAAGAPGRAPSWDRLVATAGSLGWVGALALCLGAVATSFALHPLAYALAQLLEGYWEGLPFGRAVEAGMSKRYERWRADLVALRGRQSTLPDVRELQWLPREGRPVQPTALGNTLRAGEERACGRYGYETQVVIQHLLELASPSLREEATETRNQVDMAVRLCTAGMLAVPVTTVLLWPYERWLLLPLGCYLFAWAAYRSAIAASKQFSQALAVLVDFHHLQLWDALCLPRPANLDEELVRAPTLNEFLAETNLVSEEAESLLSYVPATGPVPPSPPRPGRGRRWLIRLLGGIPDPGPAGPARTAPARPDPDQR